MNVSEVCSSHSSMLHQPTSVMVQLSAENDVHILCKSSAGAGVKSSYNRRICPKVWRVLGHPGVLTFSATRPQLIVCRIERGASGTAVKGRIEFFMRIKRLSVHASHRTSEAVALGSVDRRRVPFLFSGDVEVTRAVALFFSLASFDWCTLSLIMCKK